MPSPFPGMDPYLEDPVLWSDFHLTFLVALRPELNKGLPSPYVVRLDRYVWVEEEDGEPRLLGRPDAFIADPVGETAESPETATTVAPLTITLPVPDRTGKPYLKIIDGNTYQVVTVIELLSPSNKKPGKDRDLYLAKREEYLTSRTNLIEIDLLRKGLRAPTVEPVPQADYRVIVGRSAHYPKAAVWWFSVRDLLPDIRVPLKPGEPEPFLALGSCLRAAYDLGNYERDLNYNNPPRPALEEPDATWARELLASKGS